MECELTALYMQFHWFPSEGRASGFKSAAVRMGGLRGAGDQRETHFISDDRSLVKVRRTVLALGGIAAAMGGPLGISHLALALAQLSHIALEAQTELGFLHLGGVQGAFLQVHALHVHHLLGWL